MEDEYEIIPVSPLRRMERRIDRIEKSGGTEASKELIEILKANQRVIDDMVKFNAEMMTKVSTLLESVNAMTGRVNDFMTRIEVIGAQPAENEGELEKKVDERLGKLEKRVNALLLTSLAVKRKAQQQ